MALQEMLQNNPKTQEVVDYINQNGGNPEQVFYQTAQKRGVDPQVYINQANQLLNQKR